MQIWRQCESGGPIFPLVVILAALLGTASACTKVGYLVQAAHGQLDLSMRTVPIDELIDDKGPAPEKLRSLLQEVPHIKAHGIANGLASSDNYEVYAELERDAAVWVVTAAEPLAFEAKTWSFPLFGSFPYLGWFDRGRAEGYASRLSADGWDTYVRGAGAYSTLGWFQDPILSTMFARSRHPLGDLTNTVLHESVHATIHIDGQAFFNEGLATFVGDALTLVYLKQTRGPLSAELRSYVWVEAGRAERRQQMLATYDALAALYGSGRPREEMLREKRRIIARLQSALDTDKPMNNATLLGIRTYHAATQAFVFLFEACGQDWPRFLAAAATATEASFIREQQEDLGPVVEQLAAENCSTGSAGAIIAAPGR